MVFFVKYLPLPGFTRGPQRRAHLKAGEAHSGPSKSQRFSGITLRSGSGVERGWPASRNVRRRRSAPGVCVPSCGATRKSRPVPSSLRPPSPAGAVRAGRSGEEAGHVGARTTAAATPVPSAASWGESARGPGGVRCVSPAGLLPASAAAAAVAVPGSLPRCRDGDSLLPGEGSEAERAAPAHPVQAAEGGGQQVLRRLRGQR